MSDFYADGVIGPRPSLLAGADGIIITAPRPVLASRLGFHSITGIAPSPAFSASLMLAQTFSFAITAPAPSGQAALIVGEILTVVVAAPPPSLAALLSNQARITVAGTASAPRRASTFLPGGLFSAALTAAHPIMAAAGYPAYTITAGLVAPTPRLDAVLSSAILAAYRTWVLNTRKAVLTEYGPEFAFNSFAQFNGKTLACGPSGLVVLGTQSFDNATPILARARSGQESFASSLHKRVPRIYVSGAFSGGMLFRTITTEGGTRTYALPFNGVTGVQQRRVPVGKGPKSRMWQFEIENVDGGDFDLNDMLVYPTKLRRRVQ